MISDAQENGKVREKEVSLFPRVNFFSQHIYFIKVSDSLNVYKIRTFLKGLKCMHTKFQLIQGNRLAYRARESYGSKLGNRKSRPGYPCRALGI